MKDPRMKGVEQQHGFKKLMRSVDSKSEKRSTRKHRKGGKKS